MVRPRGVYWLAVVCLAWAGCWPSPGPRDGSAPTGVGYTKVDFMDSDRSRTLETTLWYPTPGNLPPTEQV